MKILFQGSPGAYSHTAALEVYPEAEIISCKTFDECFFKAQKDEKIYAIGGRVLNFVSLSNNFSDAKIKIVQNLDKLNWSGGFYRKDIGYKVTE